MEITAAEVSVVIPSYRGWPRLREALESIYAQTTPPGEIVVADDASGDELTEAVLAVATSHPEIPLVLTTSKVNQGPVENRNRGIRASSGSWIANLDHDDVWLPTKLERQVAFVNEWRGAPIALLGTWGYNVNDRREILSLADVGITTLHEYEWEREHGRVCFNIHSSTLFRRDDFDTVGGYDSEYGFAEDLSLFSRLADLGVALTLPEPLLLYRKHWGSLQLVQFHSQNDGLERLQENLTRGLDGRPPLDEAAYAALVASRPWPTRTLDRVQRRGMWHYRNGAMQMANDQRLRGTANLGAAAVLDPSRVRAGLTKVRDHRRSSRSS